MRKRFLFAGLLIVVGLSVAVAVRAAQRPIRAEVNLVTVLASVLDPSGLPVPDLPVTAFELLEEGRPQQIEIFERETNLPLDVALMIDASLSMTKEMAFGRAAAVRFLRQLLRPGDRLAVFQFSDAVDLLVDFSADPVVLERAVHRVSAGAGTSLYDALLLGAQSLEGRPSGRRRVLVLVTDAGETTSRADFQSARRAVLRSEALIYTILIRPVKSEGGRNTAGEHALLTLAELTGGALYPADDVAELDALFARVEQELRTQYRLGYYPNPRPHPGSYRRIELRLRSIAAADSAAATDSRSPGSSGYHVRYRRGYYAGQLPE
ncbi:MAG: VWA domain-containing protein [Firmicutes bacterium]|nr:VWA domain-containing protein [Bacillota bacterium]